MMYTLTQKQLSQLQTQLHGKQSTQPNLASTHKQSQYTLTKDLLRVVIISLAIISAQLILLRLI